MPWHPARGSNAHQHSRIAHVPQVTLSDVLELNPTDGTHVRHVSCSGSSYGRELATFVPFRLTTNGGCVPPFRSSCDVCPVLPRVVHGVLACGRVTASCLR